MWRCANCHEEVSDEFNACWNCGTGQDGTPDPEFTKVPETVAETEAPPYNSSMTPVETPRSLRVVATFFLVFGLLAVAEIVIQLALGKIYLTTGVLGIPIYFGLLRHSAGWRILALVFLWCGFIVIPLIAIVGLLETVPTYFDLFGSHIARIPGWFVAAFSIPFFFLNLWQYRVLVSARVRPLFYGSGPNSDQQAP